MSDPSAPCRRIPLRKALANLRLLFNDDSYERYREAQARCVADETPRLPGHRGTGGASSVCSFREFRIRPPNMQGMYRRHVPRF